MTEKEVMAIVTPLISENMEINVAIISRKVYIRGHKKDGTKTKLQKINLSKKQLTSLLQNNNINYYESYIKAGITKNHEN